DTTSSSSDHKSELGSLEPKLRDEFKGSFDIVVGNPPWTGWKHNLAEDLDQCMAELIRTTGLYHDEKIAARYGSPDIAFLLAARSWAKPNGAIGFALHARFLFQPAAFSLRRIVFSSMRV